MIRLTWDGTAEPVSRNQVLRRVRGQGNIIFRVQLTTSRFGNLTRLSHTLLNVMTIRAHIHTVVSFCFLRFVLKKKMNPPGRLYEHPPVRRKECQNV